MPTRPLASAGRSHVVGLVLLALLLQALSPLLHARLSSLLFASYGQRVDIATFCLPGRIQPPSSDDTGGQPSPRLPDCPLCVGGAVPAVDLPVALEAAKPPPSATVDRAEAAPETLRVTRAAPAHRPRGPPSV